MPESFAGIAVPEGEPGALEAGGARLQALAGRLEGVRGGLTSLPGALAGWMGPASIAYEGGTLTNGSAVAAAIESLQACAAATRRYAAELERAQRKAERAIDDAREAQRRIDAAEAAITDAQARAGAAGARLGVAETRIVLTSIVGAPDAGAEAEASAARSALADAQADESAARRQLEAARDELAAAQRRGREAEEDAEDAGTAAAHAYSGAGLASPLVASAGQPAMPREAAANAPKHPMWGRGGTPAASNPQFTDAEQERLRQIEEAQRELEEELNPDEGGGFMGWIHGGLDAAGFVPGLGAIPDVVNAGLYAVRGEGGEALWSLGAAVPIAGDAAKGVKIGKNVVEEGAERAGRRTWRESEDAVGRRLDGQGYDAQRSFKDGEPVPYGTRGSTRPDYYKPGDSIEVKNYNVMDAAGRDRLVSNVADQAVERAKHLPPGTPQRAMVDVMGQDIPPEVLVSLAERIAVRSEGRLPVERITFLID